MNIKIIQTSVERVVKENATTILTAGGVVGTVATAVLAGRASIKAHTIIREEENRRSVQHIVKEAQESPPANIDTIVTLKKTEKLLLAGPYFVPPVLTGGFTIAAIIMANRMSAQKAAALAAAYGLSQKQFEEYREKVAEKLTGPKNQQIKDELAQDRVNKTPGSSKIVIIEGGDVLVFDAPTGRYFKSSMEKINRAVNSVNTEIIGHDWASASQFYDELELPPTTWTNDVGWNKENMLELDVSTTQDEEGRPCLVIDFKSLPTADYQRRMWD